MPNSIAIIGNLGADAERRKAGEHDVASLRVACTTGWGEHKITTWWNVEVWGRSVEWLGELRKGQSVTVIGEAYLREYQTRDGATGTSLCVRASHVEAHERRESAGGHGGAGGSGGGAGNGAGGGRQQQPHGGRQQGQGGRQQSQGHGGGNGGGWGNQRGGRGNDDIPF